MLPEISLDLVFALLLAAAAGWFAAHYLQRVAHTSKPHQLSKRPFSEQYFEGLNYLVNEQQDKALAVLVRMTELDSDTVETHLALGNLYRRRGEVERAIRVHEHVMERQALSSELREQAMLYLAEDYFRAGLFDRAETLYQRLTQGLSWRTMALRQLLQIYEQQSDWVQAIATYEQLERYTSPEYPTALAHYYCELAQQARRNKQFDEARRLLRVMRAAQRHFPRGLLLRADIALDMGEATLAARLCRRVIELHPQLLPLALQRYAMALRAGIDDPQLALSYQDTTMRAQLAYAAIVAGLQSEPFLLACLPDYLRHDPNLSELLPALAGDPSQFTAAQLAQIAAALGRIFQRTQRYRCVDCGFLTSHHFWQCPGCRSWDTMAPVTRLELAPIKRAHQDASVNQRPRDIGQQHM